MAEPIIAGLVSPVELDRERYFVPDGLSDAGPIVGAMPVTTVNDAVEVIPW